MVGRFSPTVRLNSVLQITPNFLKKLGIRGVIVDMDNTIAMHNDERELPGVTEWLKTLTAEGVAVTVLSNNHEARVKPLAEKLGIGYVHSANKPRRGGYRAAMQGMGTTRENTLMVGDQLFTDVFGAARAGLRSVLVDPIHEKENTFIKVKRLAEKPFLRNHKK